MTSAYGATAIGPNSTGDAYIKHLPYLPMTEKLRNGSIVTIDLIRSESDVKRIENLLNIVIEEGMSWPFEEPLSSEQFRNYFLSHAALVARNSTGMVIGAFYCKPNFPGRCSHFCNGGFITDPVFRRQGIGKCMGRVFLRVARDIGFRAVLFNLVFVSNTASIRLWDSLGFKELARLPRVGRLKQGEFDAVQYYYDLEISEASKQCCMKKIVSKAYAHLPRIAICMLLFMAGRISASAVNPRSAQSS